MAFPGTFNFNYYRGDTNQFVIRPKTANGAAFDLTGYTASAQMRKYSGSSTFTTFTSSISVPNTLGKIIISLTSNQTVDLKPGRYVYDVVITRDGVKTRVIEGMVLVREGVTR